MNKILLVFVFLSNNILAQNLSVRSFKILENDLSARLNGTSEKDLNNRLCAIIKVQTLETGFDFDNGILGIVKTVQNKGEIWVYVPRYTKFLTISHSKLGVLRNYEIPIQIDEGRVYELVLFSGRVEYLINEESINGFLTVETNITEALVEIDDKKIGQTTPIYNYSLSEGVHKIVITKQNYITISETIKIIRDENNKLFYNLKLKAGNLIIKLNPEVNARVLIDGTEQSALTPDTISNVLSGKHILSIIKDFYETIETEITIIDNQNLNLEFNIKPLFGNIKFSVTPKDAEIWIDKKFMGNGSFTGKIFEGTHFLEIKKENYYSQQKNFYINIGDDMKEKIELKPITGNLSIITEPIDLTILINGEKYNKKTPITIRNLIIGDYEIKIKREGYIDVVKNITIEENKTLELNEKVDAIDYNKTNTNNKEEEKEDKNINNYQTFEASSDNKNKRINSLIGFGYVIKFSDKYHKSKTSDNNDSAKLSYYNFEISYGILTRNKRLFFGVNFGTDFSQTVINYRERGISWDINLDFKYISPERRSFLYFRPGYGYTELKDEFINIKTGIGLYFFEHHAFSIDVAYNLNYGENFVFHNFAIGATYLLNISKRRQRLK